MGSCWLTFCHECACPFSISLFLYGEDSSLHGAEEQAESFHLDWGSWDTSWDVADICFHCLLQGGSKHPINGHCEYKQLGWLPLAEDRVVVGRVHSLGRCAFLCKHRLQQVKVLGQFCSETGLKTTIWVMFLNLSHPSNFPLLHTRESLYSCFRSFCLVLCPPNSQSLTFVICWLSLLPLTLWKCNWDKENFSSYVTWYPIYVDFVLSPPVPSPVLETHLFWARAAFPCFTCMASQAWGGIDVIVCLLL